MPRNWRDISEMRDFCRFIVLESVPPYPVISFCHIRPAPVLECPPLREGPHKTSGHVLIASSARKPKPSSLWLKVTLPALQWYAISMNFLHPLSPFKFIQASTSILEFEQEWIILKMRTPTLLTFETSRASNLQTGHYRNCGCDKILIKHYDSK